MNKLLLELANGGIITIKDDRSYQPGCPTCDYDSVYTSYFDIELTTMKIYIESSKMYEYPLSQGLMMNIILHNIDDIQKMTEEKFAKWLKKQLKTELKKISDEAKIIYKIYLKK